MSARTTLALLFFAFASVAARAQESGSYPAPLQGPSDGGYHHASTFAEGHLRGLAELSRGHGEYNYNTALANLVMQDAYSRSLDNEVKKTETFFKKRQINAYARMAEQTPRASPEAIARFNKERTPKRLAPRQFDAASGTIHWPAAFKGEGYAPWRGRIGYLFSRRTVQDSGLGSENHKEVEELTRDMRMMLDKQVREMSPSEYIVAKKFIDSLGYEARFELQPQSVASK